MKRNVEIKSLEDLESFAGRLAGALRPGTTVALIGELGAGKTTLSRMIVAALGSRDPVSSPTYVLQHCYEIPDSHRVEHWDLYRVKLLPEELLEAAAPHTIRLIEWANLFSDLTTDVSIVLSLDSENTRSIKIEAPDDFQF